MQWIDILLIFCLVTVVPILSLEIGTIYLCLAHMLLQFHGVPGFTLPVSSTLRIAWNGAPSSAILVLASLIPPFPLANPLDYPLQSLTLAVLGGASHGFTGAFVSQAGAFEVLYDSVRIPDVLGLGSASVAGALAGFLFITNIRNLLFVREYLASKGELTSAHGGLYAPHGAWGRWGRMNGNYNSSLGEIPLTFTS